MAKHKKTRKQKITAEVRRKLQHDEPSFAYTAKDTTHKELNPVSKPVTQLKTSSGIISVDDYRYLVSDLRKIIFVTAAIIVIQLILHFIVKI
jgi:hypothetical protein